MNGGVAYFSSTHILLLVLPPASLLASSSSSRGTRMAYLLFPGSVPRADLAISSSFSTHYARKKEAEIKKLVPQGTCLVW